MKGASAMKGIQYLRQKLAQKAGRVELRYGYYEMKKLAQDFNISTPPNLRAFMQTLGWCAKSADAMADRLQFRAFDNDAPDFTGIFAMNNPDVLIDSAILSALISSCSFIYISRDESGFPRLQCIDGASATGIIDPITMLLTEGYAILERNTSGTPTKEAYFRPYATEIIETDYDSRKSTTTVYESNCPYPLLVPIIYKPDAKRPFGHSRISRACMDIQNSAARTLKRSEISAEFYSFPQKYVVGLSADAEPFDKWRATMSSLLEFTKDDEGDKPSVGQFTQQSMSPHIEQLRMHASLFAGETGLTLDDLGFVTENPSSSDAIKAAHENLRLSARKAQRTFGACLVNVGMVASCLRDNQAYERKAFYQTKPLWYPVFEPDASSLAGTGDALIKISSVAPEFVSSKVLTELTGIVGGE